MPTSINSAAHQEQYNQHPRYNYEAVLTDTGEVIASGVGGFAAQSAFSRAWKDQPQVTVNVAVKQTTKVTNNEQCS